MTLPFHKLMVFMYFSIIEFPKQQITLPFDVPLVLFFSVQYLYMSGFSYVNTAFLFRNFVSLWLEQIWNKSLNLHCHKINWNCVNLEIKKAQHRERECMTFSINVAEFEQKKKHWILKHKHLQKKNESLEWMRIFTNLGFFLLLFLCLQASISQHTIRFMWSKAKERRWLSVVTGKCLYIYNNNKRYKERKEWK